MDKKINSDGINVFELTKLMPATEKKLNDSKSLSEIKTAEARNSSGPSIIKKIPEGYISPPSSVDDGTVREIMIDSQADIMKELMKTMEDDAKPAVNGTHQNCTENIIFDCPGGNLFSCVSSCPVTCSSSLFAICVEECGQRCGVKCDHGTC